MKPSSSRDANGRDARIERLRASRAQDSEAKTTRALEAVRDLLGSGRRITVAQVAREAAVSTWFVYNQPQVHDAVQAAMATQRKPGRPGRPSPNRQQVPSAALQTELALARDEIKDLKQERERLLARVRLSLGAELDNVGREQLVARVQQLERENADLNRELSDARDRQEALTRRLQESEDDLTAARSGLRRAIRSVPSP